MAHHSVYDGQSEDFLSAIVSYRSDVCALILGSNGAAGLQGLLEAWLRVRWGRTDCPEKDRRCHV